MSTYIKAGLWTKKKHGNNGELDLDLLIKNSASGSIATTIQGTLYSINPVTTVPGELAANSIFLGQEAGFEATSASNSNFFGQQSGRSATVAHYSNFFGGSAGYQAINANDSNFFGYNAGINATSADNSNFFGNGAGGDAVTASNCNFFGSGAGSQSTGSNVNGFGANVAIGNTLSGQTIFSNGSLPSFVNRAAAVAAITVVLGASAGSTYLYYNETTFGIEAVRL